MSNIPSSSKNKELLIQLRQLLTTYFDLAELRQICFDLGVDYEELEGRRKSEKIISLLAYLQRHSKLLPFLELLKKERPNVFSLINFPVNEDHSKKEKLVPSAQITQQVNSIPLRSPKPTVEETKNENSWENAVRKRKGLIGIVFILFSIIFLISCSLFLIIYNASFEQESNEIVDASFLATRIVATTVEQYKQSLPRGGAALPVNPNWQSDQVQPVAFVLTHEENADIYVVESNGSNLLKITDSFGTDLSPSWSPDGRRILFTSNREGVFELYLVNFDGSGLRKVPNSPKNVAFPFWSPDGERVALVIENNVYVFYLATGELLQLTNNEANDWSPKWSPDGKRIVFTSDRDGDNEIYVMNADGAGITQLTNNQSSDFFPDWSPDGSQIAFISDRDGITEIYTMNQNGSNQSRLTDIGGLLSPSWSSDSKIIVATGLFGPKFELFLFDELEEVIRLPLSITIEMEGNIAMPAWRP